MDNKEILLKAYLGECVPGLIHNMGNPLGALLGFVSIMREEVTWLRHDMETYSDDVLRDRVKDSLTKISELFDFAARSERSLRKALEKMVLKCGKDFDTMESEIDLNELVKIETDVLMTNAFFKHKINKKFEYATGPFFVKSRWSAFSQPIGSMLLRYTLALSNVQNPLLTIRTIPSGKRVTIELTANTQLSQSDLAPTNGFCVPALTLEECSAMMGTAGTIVYKNLDGGNSSVTFDIALQDSLQEKKTEPSVARITENISSIVRSPSTEVSL